VHRPPLPTTLPVYKARESADQRAGLTPHCETQQDRKSVHCCCCCRLPGLTALSAGGSTPRSPWNTSKPPGAANSHVHALCHVPFQITNHRTNTVLLAASLKPQPTWRQTPRPLQSAQGPHPTPPHPPHIIDCEQSEETSMQAWHNIASKQWRQAARSGPPTGVYDRHRQAFFLSIPYRSHVIQSLVELKKLQAGSTAFSNTQPAHSILYDTRADCSNACQCRSACPSPPHTLYPPSWGGRELQQKPQAPPVPEPYRPGCLTDTTLPSSFSYLIPPHVIQSLAKL
jgi:hypothetical protein